MVKHLPTTDKSYEKYQEILCNRYDNEGETISNLIDEILNNIEWILSIKKVKIVWE